MLLFAAIVALFGGVLPAISTEKGYNKNGIPIGRLFLTFVINFFVALLFVWWIVPFAYGPLLGIEMFGFIMVFGIINAIISGAIIDNWPVGASILLIYAGIFIAMSLAGSTLFSTDKYRNCVEVLEDGEWEKEINPIDETHIRQVPKESAQFLGNKILNDSEDVILGSRFNLGNYSLQKIRGEQYWVAPLEFSTFWKWNKFRTTAGFVMVSAEDPTRKAELFDEHELKYMPSAHFGYKLKRHLFYEGYQFKGLTEYTFEIDDDLNPWWVVTVYHPSSTYYLPKVDGVVIVNPETGKNTFYEPEEAPGWVDRVIPRKFSEKYVTWWGKYQGSWWNANFPQDNVKEPTICVGLPTMWLVFDQAGDQNWFSGLTSASTTSQDLIGFVLIDSRLGTMKEYSAVGTNEAGAIDIANASVSNFNGEYRATQPILYNIYNNLTWFVPIISSKGILQKVVIVRAENSTWVLEDNLRGALASYQSVLAEAGLEVVPTTSAEYERIEKMIATRVRAEATTNGAMYYIHSDDVPEILFSCNPRFFPEVRATDEGDLISIGYIDTKEPVVSLREFDNLKINLRKSNNQRGFDVRRDTVVKESVRRSDVKDIKKELDEMSAEELLELKESMKK